MSAVRLASGIVLSYVERGGPSGPTVVMLPGPTDTWRSYEPVLDLLPSDIHAIAISQRGHGASDKPRHGYRITDFATDAVQLLDALAVERAVLVGHSGSCLTARRMAIDHPERVAGLFLEAAPTTLCDDRRLGQFVNTTLAGLDDPLPREFVRTFVTETSSRAVPAALVEILVTEVATVPAHVWRRMFSDLHRYDDRAELSRIAVQTVLVWGDADPIVSRSMQVELAGLIMNSELVVLPGLGHTPRWEAPERFAQMLTAFARETRGR